MDLKKKIERLTVECKEMPFPRVAIASQMSDGAEIEPYSGPQHQVHLHYRSVDLSSGVSYVKTEDISEDIFTWIQANPSGIQDPYFAPDLLFSVQSVIRGVGIPVKGSADHPPLTVWVRMILQKSIDVPSGLLGFNVPLPTRIWYVDKIYNCQPQPE